MTDGTINVAKNYTVDANIEPCPSGWHAWTREWHAFGPTKQAALDRLGKTLLLQEILRQTTGSG